MFGERLKTLRKNKGLSQKELGDLFDLGQTTIANYEKNIRFPSPVVLVQIADFFDCTLDELMGRDQDEIELFSDDELMDMTEKVRALALKEDEKQLRSIFADMSLSVGRLIQLYEKVMMPVMIHIGDLWQDGQITIAKEHYVTNLLFSVISGLKSSLHQNSATQIEPDIKRPVICMSLSSEPHTLGLRMISDYFDMLGFKPYYLGTNVPTSALIEMIADVKPEILAVSATMSYHVDSLTNLIQVIRKEPSLKQVVDHGLRFVVGGQGFVDGDQAIAIGADLYAADYASLRNGLAALGKIDMDEAI